MTCRDGSDRTAARSSFKAISSSSLERNHLETRSFLTREFGRKKGRNRPKEKLHGNKLRPKAFPAKKSSVISFGNDAALPATKATCEGNMKQISLLSFVNNSNI